MRELFTGPGMSKILIVAILFLAYSTSYSCGQNLKISAPTTVSVNWPTNENILDLQYWFNYLIFVGIVLVAIILIGILLEALDLLIWCSRRCCNCCGGYKLKGFDPYSGPGYSKKRVCSIATVVMLLFLVILGAAGVYVAFNALFSINIRKIVDTGNSFLKSVNGTINNAITATSTGLPDAISKTITEIKDITITPAKKICTSIGGINDILDNVDTSVTDIGSLIPEIGITIPNEIIDILNDANNKITFNSSSSKPISNVNFDTDSVVSKLNDATDKIAEAKAQVTKAKTDCSNTMSDIEDKFSNPNNNFFSPVIVEAQNSLFQIINSLTSILSTIGLDQFVVYVSYVNIADSVRLAVEMVIVALPLLMFTVVSIGICANKKIFFKAPAFCIFISFWLFFIISSLHIAFWIITKDICLEIPQRQGTFLELVGNLTGNPLAQLNTTIPQAANGILTCDTDFVSAVFGGSENAGKTLQRLVGLDSGLSATISGMTTNIKVDQGISVGNDVSSSFSSLHVDYNSLTSSFTADLAKFKNSLTDIEHQANTTLNTAITYAQQNGNPSLSRGNIASYCVTHSSTEVCIKYQNYVDATTQVTVVFADLDKIDEKLALLKSKIEDVNSIIDNNIKTAPQTINDKAESILASVTTLVGTINNSTSSIIDTVMTNVLGVFTTSLSCSYIPAGVKNLGTQFCSGVVQDSLIIGVSSFAVGVLCAVGFIFILLIDKYRTYQLKVQGKDKEKPKKSEKKKNDPVDLLRQIELTEDRDNARAKGAAPTLEDLSPPSYEDSANFFY